MKIAILGAGFTGLAAALRLSQQGHQVTIFEKEASVGGLAIGFKQPEWQWSLEKAYHHWFTNDKAVLNLARELQFPVIIKRPKTNVLINNKQFTFDSPLTLLAFTPLPLTDRLRVGLASFFLKIISNPTFLGDKKAIPWIKKYMGQKSYQQIWEPLFKGKFGDFKDSIALSWFWARIKKRTTQLAYPEGGFQKFAERLAAEAKKSGTKIYLNTAVTSLKNNGDKIILSVNQKNQLFDKVIVTLPSPIFTKITVGLPNEYVKRINTIKHLHAQILILTLNKPLMNKTYWLNITDQKFPFLVLAEHTNFMDPKYYGNEHIVYIGNYLPSSHKYLKMNAKQLLKKFDPYLKKINPTYRSSLITHHLFLGPFAQPIVTTNYNELIPQFKTPLKNVYLANLDMVYPWDRGTNYAVEMGEEITKIIDENHKN